MKIKYEIMILDRIQAAIDAAEKENRTIKKIELESWEWLELKSCLPLSANCSIAADLCSLKIDGVLVCPIGDWYGKQAKEVQRTDIFERVKGGWQHVPFKINPSMDPSCCKR